MASEAEEILFRSHDGLFLFARGNDGSLRAVMAEGERVSWRGDERHRALAAAFDRYGLWSHLTDEDRAAARLDVETGCYPFEVPQLAGRLLLVDGEELVEGGVEGFLANLAPVLARFGLVLDVVTVHSPYLSVDDVDYVVAVNGVRCTVFTDDEWGDDDDFSRMWAQAVLRPLAVVNRLLTDVGPIRAHVARADTNEALLLFADPRAVDAMRASGLFAENEVPTLVRCGH